MLPEPSADPRLPAAGPESADPSFPASAPAGFGDTTRDESPVDDSSARAQLTTAQAVLQVVLCSGYPTQITLAAVLVSLGMSPMSAGALSPSFVFVVSTADTVLLLAFIWYFLHSSGERAHVVLLGQRPVQREIIFGIWTTPVILVVVVALQVFVRTFVPYLRTVETSPFAPLLASPWLLAGLILLVLVAGGVREEVQRAFLLHRFEQRLGGGRVGLLVTSVAFGLGHTLQGWDAALLTGLMGAFWGVIYLRRGSVAGTVTSHALFNFIQVIAGYAALTRA